jgi:serine O-acetyltransferase
MFAILRQDLRRKARWIYGSDRWPAVVKVLLTSGTMAMIVYRLMQWSRRHRLGPLELIFNKLNAICCNCIIGRGAEFGPGLVFIQSTGLVINGRVRGGSNVTLYHQVTLGGEQDRVPVLGDDVLIAAGAKVVGPVRIGDGATVGLNSAVFRNVPPNTTVLGVPAQPVWSADSEAPMSNGRATSLGPASPSPWECQLRGDPRPTTIPHDANRAELESRLVHCFAAAFGNLSPEEIPRAAVSSLAEWDSLASMTLVALIEEEFRLRIDVSDIARLTSFLNIVDYLLSNAAVSRICLSMTGGWTRDHAR